MIFTKKKMGAQTAEANDNAGVAAANQIVGFFEKGASAKEVCHTQMNHPTTWCPFVDISNSGLFYGSGSYGPEAEQSRSDSECVVFGFSHFSLPVSTSSPRVSG